MVFYNQQAKQMDATQMHEKYDRIMENLKAAKKADDKRKIKTWRNKLEKWRMEYGANSPIR